MKILNAYSGIGGNRKNWDGENHDIVAVEYNEEIAKVYRDFYPTDKVIVTDAHQYILENFQDFDFIWSSPPCPTHSSIRKAASKNGQYDAKYPSMNLYEEIIFLKHYFDGDWVVENVNPYYRDDIRYKKSDLLIEPQESGRHLFWSNFSIPNLNLDSKQIHKGNCSTWQNKLGIDISSYTFESVQKRKVLRNCVDPKLGEAILKSMNNKQTTLRGLK